MEKEINEKIQEMQLLEQSIQNLLLQKQTFNLEVSETQNALNELENSNEDVFKIIGQIMIKTEKKKLEEELRDKDRILSLRLKSLEKQEKNLLDKAEKLREEIMSSIKE